MFPPETLRKKYTLLLFSTYVITFFHTTTLTLTLYMTLVFNHKNVCKPIKSVTD